MIALLPHSIDRTTTVPHRWEHCCRGWTTVVTDVTLCLEGQMRFEAVSVCVITYST